MINPMKLMQVQDSINKFKENHPKFPLFVQAVGEEGMKEGTVIEIAVTTPEGKNFHSNLKLTASDIELLQNLKN